MSEQKPPTDHDVRQLVELAVSLASRNADLVEREGIARDFHVKLTVAQEHLKIAAEALLSTQKSISALASRFG